MAQKVIPLNLDELTVPTKTIVLDGVTHVMRELTVQEFIERSRQAQEVEAQDADLTMAQKIEKMVEVIHDAFPTLAKERLGRLSLTYLTKIIEFTLKAPEEIEREVEAQTKGNA
jgi:hypothetical protein